MTDSGGAKSSSAIVLAERRPHRPGGCGGIFSQLFEWNRKFAKKLLFSNKVLPSDRSKQTHKKFGGHEKLPVAKLLLIADENSGGFPSAKKNRFRDVKDDRRLLKHEMRSPSLVARLMGLESMPAKNETHHGSELSKSKKEVCSSEKKEGSKSESRPQKIRKTGPSDSRGVARFGADALQLKGVLSRARKHHTKLASPVKSPRSASARSASRFIGAAATKILEPRLQAKSRNKYALTYSNRTRQGPNSVIAMGESPFRSPELPEQFGYDGSVAESLKEQPSCKTCGNPLDVRESGQNMKEEHSNSPCSTSYGSNYVNSEVPTCSIAGKTSVRGEPVALVFQAKGPLPKHVEEQITDGKSPQPKGKTEWNLASQNCKSHLDALVSSASHYKTQNQMAVNKDRSPARLNSSYVQNRRVSPSGNAESGEKDFVAVSRIPSSLHNRRAPPAMNPAIGPKIASNRSQSARAKPRMAIKMDSCKLEAERKYCNKQGSSSSSGLRSPVPKKTNIGKTVVNTGPSSSTCGSLWSDRQSLVNGKELLDNAGLVDGYSQKRRLSNQRDGGTTSDVKSTDGPAFIFSSPSRHRAFSGEMDKNQRNTSSQQKTLMLGEKDINMPFLNQLPRRGDGLGSFLEQKLKELSHQEEDELGGNQPKRPTAAILQELIHVLSKEMPISNHTSLHNEDVCQAEAETTGISNRFNGCHLSPGSVLEASFSNDSCFSSNSSGVGLHPDLMEPDWDALDSAIRATGTHRVTHLINLISRRICNIGAGLTGYKLKYATEVILNAELLFIGQSRVTRDFVLGTLMLDKLENLACATPSAFFLSFDRSKEVNQLRAFLVDCALEYLDSKYVSGYKFGYSTWRRFQLSLSEEALVHEVVQEIRRWAQFAGKLPDEIIDREMSHSLGKWTDFEIEAFELSAEIGGDILLDLVDEIAADLCC